MTLTRLPLVLATACAVAGCSDTYLLKSTYVASSQSEVRPDIIQTKTYKDKVRLVTTVAVRAPDSCANQTLDAATGGAASGETVLKTQCGIEMVEVERALTKKGYRVISWKDLNRELGLKSNENKSVAQIAAALGAEVLFQINSLEKSTKLLGKDARWERTYFASDKFGAEIKEASFDDNTRLFFKAKYLEPQEKQVDLRRLAVTLDANAVYAKTGESIWYYRWTHADAAAADYVRRVLLVCDDIKDRDCESVPMRDAAVGDKEAVRSSGESEAVSVIERPEDRERAIYAKLLQEVVVNLVTSFAQESMPSE